MSDTQDPQQEKNPDIPDEVAELHMIALLMAQELVPTEAEGNEFEPFSEEFIQGLGEYILDLSTTDDEEFVHAVHTVASFSAGNQESSPAMAAQLKQLLDREAIQAAVKKWQVSADPEEIKKIAERFGHFAGTDGEKKAPKVGEEKPEGALDLNALNFPKRL